MRFCNVFLVYMKLIQSKFNTNITTSVCHNGGENITNKIGKLCKTNGTWIDYTKPYTPEQNGKAEKINRSWIEKDSVKIEKENML